MPEHDPRDPKRVPPAEGPVPEPEREEPAPLPDAHRRPAPDADTVRPDQQEELGPAVELFRAAGAEAVAEVARTEEAGAEAIRLGAEPEGVEAAQVLALIVGAIVVLILIVAGTFFLVEYQASTQLERRASEAAYPERLELESRAAGLLENYAAEEGGAFRIPIGVAMEQVAETYARQPAANPAPEHFNTVVLNVPSEARGAATDTSARAQEPADVQEPAVQEPAVQEPGEEEP